MTVVEYVVIIYLNMKDKKYRELCLLPENGCENYGLYTHRSEMISNGFERIVFGKRGPFIEFNKYQIKSILPKDTPISVASFFPHATLGNGS